MAAPATHAAHNEDIRIGAASRKAVRFSPISLFHIPRLLLIPRASGYPGVRSDLFSLIRKRNEYPATVALLHDINQTLVVGQNVDAKNDIAIIVEDPLQFMAFPEFAYAFGP
jgi:hypothetical protein